MAANASRGAGAIALYARYSSELQSPRSCEDQLADLRGTLPTDAGEPRVYSDEATSGTTWDRPGLQALLRDVEAGRVREVRVEHPDRLSRDIGDADRVAKIFRHHDVALVCSNGVTLDGSAGSSLTFGVMAVLSENYLRELGAKTLRGLKGNAREGKATGGRAFGYRTGQKGRIEVVEAEARIVREIFAMYLQGFGYARIASELNRRGIEPPRGKRRAGRGWMASAIREQLRNAKYVGSWSFGKREWRKHPTTRKRTPRLREGNEVLRQDRPELAIVDRATWDQVQAKLAEHAANYRKAADERTVPHQKSSYLLTGLLRCACCGALMQLSGGAKRYYRCSANRKRGTCKNALSVKEHVARECILSAIGDALWNPGALEHIRAHVAGRLGELSRALDGEAKERRARLARTEERIRSIALMQIDGDRSPYLADMRRDFEAQAVADRGALAELEARAREPLRLPMPQGAGGGPRAHARRAPRGPGRGRPCRARAAPTPDQGRFDPAHPGGRGVRRPGRPPARGRAPRQDRDARQGRRALSTCSCAGRI